MDASANIGTKIALGQLQDQLATGKGDPVANAPGEALNSFGQILKDSMNQVSQLQATADQATQTYAVGGNIELHQVMIAAERASLALELATQVRNKMVAAYQEISRMGV